MELVKTLIHGSRIKGKASTQVTLDDDFIVPDTLEDMEEILLSRGEVRLDSVKSQTDRAMLTGRLEFALLYRKEGGGLETLTGAIPFEEEVRLSGLKERQEPVTTFEVEDFRADMIHSRKAGIRALIRFGLQCEEYIQEEVVSALSGLPGEELQTRTGALSLFGLTARRRDNVRVQEEVTLPADRPAAEKLIWWELSPRGLTASPGDHKLLVSGSFQLFLIYEEEGEAALSQWLEETIPFAEEVPLEEAEARSIAQTEFRLGHKSLELKPDEDGELRTFALDAALELEVRLYQEETAQILKDCYSTGAELVPVCEDRDYTRLLTKTTCKCRLSDKQEAAEGNPTYSICRRSGTIRLDETAVEENSLVLSGVLELSELSRTDNGKTPFLARQYELPFECRAAAEGITGDCQCQVIPGLDQLQVFAGSGGRREVKAVLSFEVLICQPFTETIIKDVALQELDLSRLDSLPGIVGYVTGGETDFFEIAKQFHTTEEALRRDNALPEDAKPVPGQKLILVKRVGKCYTETGGSQ